MEGVYTENSYLSGIVRVGSITGPEDIALSSNHDIYAAGQDGRILRYDSVSTFSFEKLIRATQYSQYRIYGEFFYNTKGRPLGMTFDANDNLVVADAVKGLIAINKEGIANTLSIKSDSDGIPLGFTDDLDIAGDGKIYFSDASSVYGIGEEKLDLMEHRPHGRLLVYDPATNKTTTLMNNLYFANGVAVSPDDSFVLLNETYMYRIHKYWLKGEKAGTSEIIIDNLPGFPDNISSNGEGIYWVALFTLRNDFIDSTTNKPFLRKMTLRLPEFLQPQPEPYALVLGIDENGKVLHNLQYGADDAYSPITSVKQLGSRLYFGSLTAEGFGISKAPELSTPYSNPKD
tara:strand:- start:43 stop:1077 length:1035 start_codon:yes stop_codon:yes gene_type:complete